MSAQRASSDAAPGGGSRTQRCVIALLIGFTLGGFGWHLPLDPRLSGEALAEALPERPDLSLEDGVLWWGEGRDGPRHAVRWGIPDAYLLVESDSAPLEVAWTLADPAFEAPLAGVGALIAAAPRQSRARVRFDPLLGDVVLDTPEGFVQRGQVWRRDERVPLRAAAQAEQASARAALRAARARIDGWIEHSELGEPGRAALRETLARLDARDRDSSAYPAPSALRRMVRLGWLEQVLPRDAEPADLRRAVRHASALRVVERLRSGSAVIERLEDAFGHQARTLQSAAATRYEVALPPPAYFADAPGTTLVVELAAGVDPLAAEPRPRAAAMFQEGVRVAEWSESAGFRAWPERWQERARPALDESDGWVLDDAIPPHVRIATALGDMQRLVTAYGEVVPERAATSQAREAWLVAAARALPDAAHLDLLGEFLFAYAHDSPEPRWPQLLGTQHILGDIHQTAAQTLATETGGMYRGDCDDLSELYQEVARRQGRNAHLVGLPAHAALAWTEREEEGGWRTYVLQTAPPLSVPGRSLEQSLEETYRSFDADAPLHADQLEVLLRFGDDNTRDTYYLSSRIFADPAYAQRMIELQENWHGWTLGRGLLEAERLAAQPDSGVPELLEFASLLEMVGELDAAAETFGRALEQSPGGAERVEIAIQQLEALFDAGHAGEARALVQRALDEWIPELERGRNAFELTLRTRLADALLSRGRDRAEALDMLAHRIAPVIAQRRHWYRSAEERYRVEDFMELAVSALHQTAGTPLSRSDAWSSLSRLAGEWLDGPAFAAMEPSESVLKSYGLLGRYLESKVGPRRYRALALKVDPPRSAEREHATRGQRRGEARLDASWVGLSPQYWWRALLDEVAFDRATLTRADALELAMQVRVARVHAEALGLDHPAFAAYTLQSEIATALAAGDDARLRTALRRVRDSGDWELEKSAALWVEEVGRRLPLGDFSRAMDAAVAELRSRPLLLQIAWRCMRSGAAQHALVAAGAAVRAHPDDAALAQEFALLQALATSRAARPALEEHARARF